MCDFFGGDGKCNMLYSTLYVSDRLLSERTVEQEEKKKFCTENIWQ